MGGKPASDLQLDIAVISLQRVSQPNNLCLRDCRSWRSGLAGLATIGLTRRAFEALRGFHVEAQLISHSPRRSGHITNDKRDGLQLPIGRFEKKLTNKN